MTPTRHSDEHSGEHSGDYPMVPVESDPQFADELLIGELTAALALEAASDEDALPPALAQRATLAGEVVVRAQRLDAGSSGTAQAAPASLSGVRPSQLSAAHSMSATPLRSVTVWGGWLAAAAMVAFIVLGGGAKSADSIGTDSGAIAAADASSSIGDAAAAALLDSLLANDAALLRGQFAGTDDPAGVGASGEVLWSSAAQRGVMRLVGLQPNDRARLQYQLWIFDKARDQRYPVDGGVFDIPAGATEVVVPIDARLPVEEAAMFAVTVEPAGGVVVSTRERIALLAEL